MLGYVMKHVLYRVYDLASETISPYLGEGMDCEKKFI